MATLSKQQVAKLWVAAGGPADEAGRAAEVADAESSLDPGARNPKSGACGLMQIHPCEAGMMDPVKNMKRAVEKFNEAGGWSPWEVCNFQNSCPPIAKTTNAALVPPNPFGDGDILPDIPNPLSAVGDIASVVKSAFEVIAEWFLPPVRIGKFIGGGIALVVGLGILISQLIGPAARNMASRAARTVSPTSRAVEALT